MRHMEELKQLGMGLSIGLGAIGTLAVASRPSSSSTWDLGFLKLLESLVPLFFYPCLSEAFLFPRL